MSKNLEAKIEEILTRGVENIYPSKQALKDVLMSRKKIRIYCGYDPTAKSLHIGNAISINKLGQFQKLGHEVIFLIGDFTGMIGDPTDKTTTRKKMTRVEVLENSKNYKKQAAAYLKFDGENPAIIKYNSEWSDKLTFKDLVEIASNFTLQQMINREIFKRELAIVKCRHCGFEWKSPIQFGTIESFKSTTLIGNTTNCPNCGKMTGLDKTDIVMKKIDQIRETPIALHEFLYPLAQAYDSVVMDVDFEIGGNDQTFNMLCGRDLMKAIKGKEKFVLTTKLLTDPTGKKMGKTEGNIINLDDNPQDMFGKIMAWPDSLIIIAYEACTDVPMEKIRQMEKDMKSGKLNPRDAKLRLAQEIVKIYHGEEKAKAAQKYFVDTFSERITPANIPVVNVKASEKLTDVLVKSGNAKSLGDARRKIEQGGVEIDGKKISDWKMILDKKYSGSTLKIGKYKFVKISFTK